MEASLKELLDEGKQSLPRTDNEEDSEICNHFTIRGYVAGARERDVKTCWPLFMPNNESSNTPSNKLPLLHVSKFKRWNCVNCLHTNCTSEDRTGNADLGVLDNRKTKKENSLSFLNSNAKRSFSRPKNFAENIIPGERLVSDSSTDINRVEFNPDPCHGKKANRFTREDVARTGLQKCIYRNFRSKENQDWSCKPTSSVAGDEFREGMGLRRKIVASKDKCLSAFRYHDASHAVCDKPNGGSNIGGPDGFHRDSEGITVKTKVNVKPDGKHKDCKKMFEAELGASGDNALTSVAVDYHPVNFEQRKFGASYCKMGLSSSMNCCPLQDSVSGDSHGKVNHKKVRKVRFIDDIMKSEELHVSKKICTFKGHRETYGVDNNQGFNASKSAAQLGDLSSTPCNDGLEVNQNKEEELSLIHWLKKVSKKFVTDDSHIKKVLHEKEHVKIQEINNNAGIYDSKQNGNGANPLRQCLKVGKHKKKQVVEKEKKVLLVNSNDNCFIPQERDWISRGAIMKKAHTGNTIPNMGRINSASSFPPALGNLDSSSDTKSRRKKVSHVKCRDSSQVKWSEKEMVKKQKTAKAVEKETLDDIPMDIVELLAKKQHERNLMNAHVTCKNKHELSIAQGYGIPIASCINQNAECGVSKSEHRKQILIDLNQQATEFLTIPQYDGHRSCATDFVDDSKKIYPFQSSWDQMRLQDLESYQKYQGFSAPCSSRATHHFLSSPFMDRKYGVDLRNIEPCCNHGKVVPYDSLFDRFQPTVSQESEVSERMNLIGSCFVSGGGTSRQSTNGTQMARSYLMEGRSRLHSGSVVPTDLHTNETVPALHLLRLVDQAAHSVASWDLNFTGNVQNSILNHPPEILGMKVGLQIRETPENPCAAVYSTCDQNEGNFSRPYRPVPRIGDLGSLLQKEIMSQSNSSSLGYKDWYFNKLPSFCIGEREKMHASSEITKSSLSANVNNKKNTEAGDSFLHKFGIGQASISKMDELVQLVRHDCGTVNCIINQNPADFSLPDDDNVYMRVIEDQSSKCIFPQHRIENTFPQRSSLYQTHHDRKKWPAAKLPVVKG
ncbi:protein EMBRYONIC FLOWER 1-like isoform X2 [Zingiber officinale]|uniref:protein EMBRYONIC FLOWER 1-like isoform X2 n=1 Tax=Zingiber officinale TaxID=94328 RepID=UPI001C4CD6CD|nr:protein EMBRYONIC FLOWER 1-like isoform X2 [Zingiber officinale]